MVVRLCRDAAQGSLGESGDDREDLGVTATIGKHRPNETAAVLRSQLEARLAPHSPAVFPLDSRRDDPGETPGQLGLLSTGELGPSLPEAPELATLGPGAPEKLCDIPGPGHGLCYRRLLGLR